MINVSLLYRPDYPALVLQGPPKAGTRTFVDTLSRYSDVIQYGPERDFWAGPNEWRCIVHYNITQWKNYLNDYKNYKTDLNKLVIEIVTDKRYNSYCYPERYRWHWNKIKSYSEGGVGSNWINKTCQHPNETITNNTKYQRYCYLIEKGPVYTRSPWVPIVYAYLMPRIKLITIVRDPLKQIISAIFAFPEPGVNKKNMNATYKWLINHLQEDESFMNFSAMCTELNTEWMKLKLDNHNGKNRYLMMRKYYRHYLFVYNWRRYVKQQFLWEPRADIYKWSSFLLPSLLSGLSAWDEIKGDEFMENVWDPLSDNEYLENRYIQFEWLYNNVAKSMKLIKCWMMNIKSNTQCDQQINEVENDILFTQIVHKNAHRPESTKQENTYYKSSMQNIWHPCNTAIQNIIRHDRPQLVIGGWYDWKYTFV